MNADGSNVVQVTHDHANDDHPHFTGYDKALVYESTAGGNWEIRRIGLDGSGETDLTRNQASDRYPAMAPRGAIAFASDRGGRGPHLWVMRANGAHPVQLTRQPGGQSQPAWNQRACRYPARSLPSASAAAPSRSTGSASTTTAACASTSGCRRPTGSRDEDASTRTSRGQPFGGPGTRTDESDRATRGHSRRIEARRRLFSDGVLAMQQQLAGLGPVPVFRRCQKQRLVTVAGAALADKRDHPFRVGPEQPDPVRCRWRCWGSSGSVAV